MIPNTIRRYVNMRCLLFLTAFLFVGDLGIRKFYQYLDANYMGPVGLSQIMDYPVSAECQDTHNGTFKLQTENNVRIFTGTNQEIYESIAAEYDKSLKQPLNTIRRFTLPWPHGAPSFKERITSSCPEKSTLPHN